MQEITKEELEKALQKMTTKELAEFQWELNKPYFRERPVDISTFLHDRMYCGHCFNKTFPKWEADLKDIFPTPFTSPYNEIIAYCGTGCGKTKGLGMPTFLYDLYITGCLNNPSLYYGTDEDTDLLFVIFSALMSLVVKVNWGIFIEAINGSPWFQARMKRSAQQHRYDYRELNMDMGYSGDAIRLFDRTYVKVASRFRQIMGQAIVSGLKDEAAFDIIESESENQYGELSSRMKTRFMSFSEEGYFPGHIILLTSPKDPMDTVRQRIEKVKSSSTSAKTKILDRVAIWDCDPRIQKFKRFGCFVGDDTRKPFIFTGNKHIPKSLEPLIIYPTINLYDEFATDITKSIKNYAGIATIAPDAFFRDIRTLKGVFKHKNPINDIIKLDFFNQNDTIEKRFTQDYFKNIPFPQIKRVYGIDLAFADGRDKYGISSVIPIPERWYYHFKQDPNFRPENVLDLGQYHFFVEWAFVVKATEDQEIPLPRIEKFFDFLINVAKVPSRAITGDTFNTKTIFQKVRQMGIEDITQSVDRTKEPYYLFRDSAYSGYVELPESALLTEELHNLRDYGRAIDHPVNGSKDLSDSICAAIYTASKLTDIFADDVYPEESLWDFTDPFYSSSLIDIF